MYIKKKYINQPEIWMKIKTRKVQKCFIILILFLSRAMMYAESSTEVLTLKQCLGEGLKKNISILNAEFDKKKAELRIDEAKSSGLPQIEASVQSLDYLKKSVMLLPGSLMGKPGTILSMEIGTQYVTSATLKFNQLLYSQTYFLALDVSKRYAKLSELSVEKTKNDFIYDLSKMYILASITNKQIDLINTNILRLDTIINITQTAVDNGYAQQVDLDRVIVNKSELNVQKKITETLYKQQTDLIR